MIHSVLLNSVPAGGVEVSEYMSKNVSFYEGWGKKCSRKRRSCNRFRCNTMLN